MIQALAVIGAALSLFLILVLAAKRPFRQADSWLVVWFLAQSAFCLSTLIGLLGTSIFAVTVLMAGQIAIVAAGPAHYLYAASTFNMARRTTRHVAVVLVGTVLLLALPFLVPIRVENGALVADLHTRWLLIIPVIGFAVAVAYPLAVVRVVKLRREQLKDHLSQFGPYDPGWVSIWAWSIVALDTGLILSSLCSFLFGWPVDVQVIVILALEVALIAYVGQRGLTRPGILFSTSPVRSAIDTLPIDITVARKDFLAVQDLFAREKPYRLPTLTAEMLADRLGWAPERLTIALRHGGAVTFFDAINAGRTREVQQLVTLPENAAVSLLVLAHEAGFGSKSAFYEAFRRHAGCTPAEWRRRQLESRPSAVPT